MKKSKHEQYFHCFIVCILGPYAFWFSFYQKIVTILISNVFRGAALIRGQALIRGRRLFRCGYPKVRCLLEEIWYLPKNYYCKKQTFSKLRFSKIKKFVTRSEFWGAPTQISLNFKTSCCNLKFRGLGEKLCGFSINLVLN